ncbi:MAG: FG-GAP repeat protein [Ignavibacteria bacterium]|nr:FG-GAP repeat protein [Ignavibacteria bacterium]
MKTFLLFFSAILLFSFSFQKENQFQLRNSQDINDLKLECPVQISFAETINSDIMKKSADKNSETIDLEWHSKAMENIQKEEYNISYNNELAAYQSPNRKNNIRFIYHKDGFTAKTRDVRGETRDEWSVDFRIRNFELGIKDKELIVSGNKAYIEDENIRIDYINTEDGMRQDFIIKQRPEGEGKLRLNLSAETELKMIVGADALMFKDKTGEDKLKYSALKCWDANGRELRAYFEEQLQITNHKLQKENIRYALNDNNICNLKFDICNSFSIVVNDEDAVYPITIDPLSTSPSWTAESNQSDAQFGFSVGTAGDVNGDGYSEVIVGAPYFDNGVADAGKTFVYHGSAVGLSATANWTSEGNSGLKNVGYSVSTAGDVNGDGYSDAIIGAKGIDPWTPQTSGTVDNLQDVYFTSSSKGCAVGGNGVIVTTVNGGINWTLRNSATSNDLRSNWFTTPDSGWAVGLAGTIKVTSNGGENWTTQTSGTAANLSCVYFRTSQEGYVVGANGLIRKTTNAGVNWTAQTSGITAELRDIIFTSPSDGWIVGAAGRILKTTNGGTNWTLQTSGTTQTLRGVYFSSSSNGLAFGHAGTILKTTDGGTTWILQTSGTTQDLFGCNFTSSLVGWTVGFGSTVLKTTDGGSNWMNQSAGVNGDLRGIFFFAANSGCVVGSGGNVYGFNPSSNSNGSIANVYTGSASGLSAIPNSILTSASTIGSQNNIVATAGDINGDGYSDVMAGYPNSDSGKGTVFIYHGSASGSQTAPNATLTGSQTGALFGISISTAGDVDGDGYSDIIAGASDFDNGHTDEGKAFVYRGSASGIITTPYWTNEGNKNFVRYGSSVSTAGDVNGDGYSDIVIGAPFDKGKASLYFGSASSISPTSNWAYDGTIGENFGSSVSSAGDVNGDGYSDVIIGSPYYNNGQTEEGRVLVFNGSATGLKANANWTIESNQASANFGNSVFTAGDINGDGFSDVIAGAKNYDNGQTDEGGAFVYNGSAAGLSLSSGWDAESDQGSSNFGWCVSSAGDVNGDGYSDVLVGARYFDNGEADEGKLIYTMAQVPVYRLLQAGQRKAARQIHNLEQAFLL